MGLLAEKLNHYQSQIDKALLHFLPLKNQTPERLHEALHYVVFNGGKRVRPTLVYATGEALGVKIEQLNAPAAAVEMIHAYSLVHDDLPAMDDDDLRRGKPTCHKAFDEATAILTGDALLTLAFQILAGDDQNINDTDARLAMIQILAQASGSLGMVGGQAIDLAAVGQDLNLEQLKNMHAHKTGALIRASVLLGAYGSAEQDENKINALTNYADCIGLSFQIRDDILDIEGDTAVIGKAQGSDEAKNKPTYPALLGMDGAKKAAQELHEQAMNLLGAFDAGADVLRELSAYIVNRNK